MFYQLGWVKGRNNSGAAGAIAADQPGHYSLKQLRNELVRLAREYDSELQRVY